MAEQPFLMMNETQASRFREDTAADQDKLDPRLVDAGQWAGWYALPRAVMFDPAFATHRDAFDILTEVAVDPDVAWPPAEEG